MSSLYLSANQVLFTGYGHMQFVYDPDSTFGNGNELEIEVQGPFLAIGDWDVRPVQPLDLAGSNRTFAVSLDAGQTAENVWGLLTNARNMFAGLNIDYRLGLVGSLEGQNSNSYVVTLAHIAGLNISSQLSGFVNAPEFSALPGAARNVLFDHVAESGSQLAPVALNLSGTAGHDRINGGNSADNVQAGAGDDTLRGYGGNDILGGEAGNDTISGDDGDDVLNGHSEDDTLNGGNGNDSLLGGTGNDTLNGDAGNDTAQGEDGDDLILGGIGDDTLSGGAGHDVIQGGNDQDSIDGGTGRDWMYGDAGNDIIDGGTQNDRAFGGTGSDDLTGGGGRDRLFGQGDADTLAGGAGNDILRGGQADDTLLGSAGDDDLGGGGGHDRLTGGNGDDDMAGGAGRDVFVFNGRKDQGDDTIADFKGGLDLIEIANLVFADIAIGGTTDALLTLDGLTTITLTGVAAGDIGAGDFIFV